MGILSSQSKANFIHFIKPIKSKIYSFYQANQKQILFILSSQSKANFIHFIKPIKSKIYSFYQANQKQILFIQSSQSKAKFIHFIKPIKSKFYSFQINQSKSKFLYLSQCIIFRCEYRFVWLFNRSCVVRKCLHCEY